MLRKRAGQGKGEQKQQSEMMDLGIKIHVIRDAFFVKDLTMLKLVGELM